MISAFNQYLIVVIKKETFGIVKVVVVVVVIVNQFGETYLSYLSLLYKMKL